MQPELVAAFVGEFSAEWNRLSGSRSGALTARRRELAQVERKLTGLMEALADGFRTTGLRERLEELEARQTELRREIATGEAMAPAPLFLPNLSEVYRARVTSLRDAMQQSASPEIREALRALIARVEVHADRLELTGHLTSMLRAAGVQGPLAAALDAESPPEGSGGLLSSAKGDAGTGFEPVTFRL
ncbi:MAG: putative recombinase [Rubritepida sp.]|nr:putative recombinase [Rubritepida sp.]